MPFVYYKTGVSSLGMDEWTGGYQCDFPRCKHEADYGEFCEEHFFELELLTEIETAPENEWRMLDANL